MKGGGVDRNTDVGIALMKSDVAEATLESLRSRYPDLVVDDEGTYYMIWNAGSIEVDVEEVGEFLGRTLDLGSWLGIMSAYVGQVETTDAAVRIISGMSQFEPEAATRS